MTTALIGREAELAVLASLVDGACADPPAGGALLVRGEPGIGKSALLDAATAGARGRGMRVLSCSGIASEAHLPYAGLHQMLWPARRYARLLPVRERDAVHAALGLADAPAAAVFVVGLATLELLAEYARRAPVLVVADDAQWLDESTREVLAFLASRLDAEPVALIGAWRDGAGDGEPLGTTGSPHLLLGPLDDTASAALLDTRAELEAAVRQRVLDEAVGNPLALVELPLALPAWAAAADAPAPLPLTARLERAYAARLPGLSPASRTVLLAAALDDGDSTAEVLAAASRAAGTAVTATDLAPAVSAGLVEVDATRIRFRHPLVRSAVGQVAGRAQRQEMHAALAEVLAAVPERRVWHRAAATVGPDEEVAAELERIATWVLRRGGTAVAAAALERAAQLTGNQARRGRLLIRAARELFGLGQPQAVLRVLDEAEPLDLDPMDRIEAQWRREILAPANRSGAQLLGAVAESADRIRRQGDADLALAVLEQVALRCWWSNPDPRVCERMAAAAEATAVPKDDPRLLFIQAMTDPVGRGTLVVQQLHRLRPGTGTPIQDHLLSFAAAGVGACDLATGFYVAAITGLREEGQLARVGQALLSQASTAVLLGRLDTAAAAADEGSRLLAETGHQFWLTSTQLVTAVIAGRRGEAAAATELAGKAEQVLLTAGLPPMLAQVQVARGVAALGAGRFSEAYQQLARIFDPHDTAYHPYVRSWALVDLVDAAVRSGDEQAARVRMAELAPLAAASPLLRVSLAVAAPMLAADEDAGDLYDQALRVDLNAWPLHRARLLLGYGSWLRRCRKVVDSRAPLRAARDAFDALGVVVGSERAREELLTAGEASGPLGASALQRLSPQESHIARLAAEGLTNREIGQQLYLSHRTISNHLYRIFTKLDIASRTELAAALSTGPSRG